MCRNITELRGLEPVATAEEIEAAARQYVRKVSGIRQPGAAAEAAFEAAVAAGGRGHRRPARHASAAQAAADRPCLRCGGPRSGPASTPAERGLPFVGFPV